MSKNSSLDGLKKNSFNDFLILLINNIFLEFASTQTSGEQNCTILTFDFFKIECIRIELKELTSNDSKSEQDLALIQQQVTILRSNTYASSIAAKCRLEIDEAEVEKEAEKNGLEDVNKIQQDLDSYNFELEEALLKLKALDK